MSSTTPGTDCVSTPQDSPLGGQWHLQSDRPDDGRVITTVVEGGSLALTRCAGTLGATASAHDTEAVFIPNMGHNMMLEPGCRSVVERIDGWLTERGL